MRSRPVATFASSGIEDPNQWSPQNHSCRPNTAYRGLNLLAVRDIRAGEELTLDYAACCDETMAAFQCQCGSSRMPRRNHFRRPLKR